MDWKKRLYDSYVTSGQAGLSKDDMMATVRMKRRLVEQMIDRFFPADKQTAVLDVGCGFGTLLYVAKERGYQDVRGVDVSPEMVEAAHRLGVQEVVHGDLIGQLKAIADGSMGLVVAQDVIEHLERQDLFDTMAEIARVLRKGGRLILHVPNAQGIFGANIRYGDLTHETSFTPQSVGPLLTTMGFGEVRCYEERPIPHGILSVGRYIVWMVGSFPYRLLFAAETGETRAVLTMNMTCVADKL